MAAVRATLPGCPVVRRRWEKLAITGLKRVVVRMAMDRTRRIEARPPRILRRPRNVPRSRLTGARPTKAAIWRRSRRPSSGSSAMRVNAVLGPTPGPDVNRFSVARQAGVARIVSWRSVSRSRRALQPGFERDEGRRQGPHAVDEGGQPGLVRGDREGFPGGAHVDVELRLGDIEAAEEVVHDPSL